MKRAGLQLLNLDMCVTSMRDADLPTHNDFYTISDFEHCLSQFLNCWHFLFGKHFPKLLLFLPPLWGSRVLFPTHPSGIIFSPE